MDYLILNGNAARIPLADNSVQCVVTSPPYLNLRLYGTPPQVWGGDTGCAHEWTQLPDKSLRGSHGDNSSTLTGGESWKAANELTLPQGAFCARCGAWRGELGQEPTVHLYIAHLVQVFHEVKRVLRPDGVCWVNIADTYAANRGYQVDGTKQMPGSSPGTGSRVSPGLKPKDLSLVPARLAIALQEDGWWIRNEIIWVKASVLPESMTDRCTRSHETIWLLAKSEHYFFDADAIKEPVKDSSLARISLMANRRDCWTVSNPGYADAHYAVMPEKLAEPMVLAGTSARGACVKCGAPWARVVEKVGVNRTELPVNNPMYRPNRYTDVKAADLRGEFESGKYLSSEHVGWRPTCDCYGLPDLPECTDERIAMLRQWAGLPTVPCTILDPFSGSGTTGRVALKHGRGYVGIELNPVSINLHDDRLTVQTSLESFI